MRRILLAVSVLILPSAVAILVYFLYARPLPTSREAVGVVSTLAGRGQPGIEDGRSDRARFSDPFGIAIDKRGDLIVADGGESNRIRRITSDGQVKTIAGSEEGYRDGDALQARFNTPSGIAIDRQGTLIIADTSNNRIRGLSRDGGTVTTIAGEGQPGLKDGPALEAQFDGPIGVAVDRKGNTFVADTYNDCIRKITADGLVTTIAGTGSPGYRDGPAATAEFDTPSGLAVDGEGNVYVADTGNRAIRKIQPAGEVTTVIAETIDTHSGKKRRLDHPVGIVVTHDGFLFISDAGTGRILRLSPEGVASVYAGDISGYRDGPGDQARFSNPSGMAIDRGGVLFVADSSNSRIRQVTPAIRSSEEKDTSWLFIQPPPGAEKKVETPLLSAVFIQQGVGFPWPLAPQHRWHELTGLAGEARGAPGGIALDHLHTGVDIRGAAGEAAYSVYDEKVSPPIATWDFDGVSEGITVGLFSYVHVTVGRTAIGETPVPDKFKPRFDQAGRLAGIRVRRGTRFRVGDFVGSVNKSNHIHLNLGPWNAQTNPLVLPFAELKDTVAPTIEENGIEVVPAAGLTGDSEELVPFKDRRDGRLVVSGDVGIVVTAHDRVDGNGANRKLGLYRLGYQLLDEHGQAIAGFEQPLFNIEFNRLPPEEPFVRTVYAPGSGVSAYGTPTLFKYIVTNRVRDGEATNGLLRTSDLPAGKYVIRVIAEDYAGNRTSGKTTELPIAIVHGSEGSPGN